MLNRISHLCACLTMEECIEQHAFTSAAFGKLLWINFTYAQIWSGLKRLHRAGLGIHS